MGEDRKEGIKLLSGFPPEPALDMIGGRNDGGFVTLQFYSSTLRNRSILTLLLLFG